VNASSDIGAQMDAFPALHPRRERESRAAGVLLTNGDLDHVLGLTLLREGPRLAVHATPAVRGSVEASGIGGLLEAFCGVDWREASGELEGGLTATAIALPGAPPPYDKGSIHSAGQSVAYQITDHSSGSRLLVAPDVAMITPELFEAMSAADIVMIDGTFWSGDELQRIREGARTAEEMGHSPIHGGSLEVLRRLPARYKVYFHINNTNPILAPDSAERAETEAAGITIGYDGLEFDL
jgi:pyrroloquinoline quinone biosynthesis protein B